MKRYEDIKQAIKQHITLMKNTRVRSIQEYLTTKNVYIQSSDKSLKNQKESHQMDNRLFEIKITHKGESEETRTGFFTFEELKAWSPSLAFLVAPSNFTSLTYIVGKMCIDIKIKKES